MSKVCYLNRSARAVKSTDGYIMSIELDTRAQFKVSFLDDKTGKWVPQSFDSLKTLSGFLRNRFHRPIYPDSIGLAFYFDENLNECEEKHSSSYCILPRGKGGGFACYNRDNTHWTLVGTGNYTRCFQFLQSIKGQEPKSSVTTEVPAEEVSQEDAPQRECTVKKLPGISNYYTEYKGNLEYAKAENALYVVRRMAGHEDWIVKVRGDKGRFVTITSERFATSDAAFQWLQLYVGSSELRFTDADDNICDFDKANRCARTVKDGSVEYYYKSDTQWLRCGIEPDKTDDVDEGQTRNFYYTFSGNDTTEECATYRGEVVQAGVLHKFYIRRDEEWVLLKMGTPEETDSFCRVLFNTNRAENADDTKPTEPTFTASTSGPQENLPRLLTRDYSVHKPHARVSGIWQLIKDTTWIRAGDLISYLALCASRNRMVGNGPIFNTRLCDWMEQPLYIYDEEFFSSERNPERISYGKLRPLFSIQEAKALYPELTFMPAPIQFSNNCMDYVWDPTKPVLPLTPHTAEHICVDRISRFPKELRGFSPTQLVPLIREALRQGEERATRDLFYALPSYSKEHDEVSMLLPVYMPTTYASKPRVIAAMVMVSGPQGYRLATILDTGRAVRSVSCFRDPRTTWLKECYDDEPIVD